jgi:hypothetical protein
MVVGFYLPMTEKTATKEMKMNRKTEKHRFWQLIAVTIALASVLTSNGQGTITFNGAALFSGTDYLESGMWFHTVIPLGEVNHDGMAGVPAIFGPSNVPENPTPYMIFLRQYSPGDYVSLGLTNGSLFGLTSVDLADPISPSLSPVPISFIGHLAGGSTVTNTFTTPGNGATTFEAYTFNPEFASQVFTHVDIFAPKWAMDNLVFVIPEPSAASLLVLGLLAVVFRKTAA